MIESAVANAKSLQNLESTDLVIKDIRVDQGPMFRYFKPGAMGRANIYRKRLSHMSVIVEPITEIRKSVGQKVNPIGFRLGIYRTLGFSLVCSQIIWQRSCWKIFKLESFLNRALRKC